MISVVVYGRNDSHGYNLQQRATLSLNSIAQALTHPDDEIIFVDWNSEIGLPSFPVTIDDVLTDQCRSLLRIIRVPSALHQSFADGRTQKPTIEPVARNVGVRRANTRNPWILSTNTDVLLRVDIGSLSSIAENLSGHYYATPRFEVPEWIWESLPRHDPVKAANLLESQFAGVLPLSVVRSSRENLFDAPGDFQLVRRKALESIGCFDETMIHGWHVDSNLAVRMARAFGEPESLEQVVQVFHCNHTRQATHFHNREDSSNSLITYVSGEVATEAKSGETDWGLPNAKLEVETLDDRAERLKTLTRRLDGASPISHDVNFMDERDRLAGIPAEVSYPFLLDQVINCQRGSVLYLGGRSDIVVLIKEACRKLETLFCQWSSISALHSTEGPILVILDLVPPKDVVTRQAKNITELCDEDKEDLLQAFSQFRVLLLQSELPLTRFKFMFINAEANEFEQALLPFFKFLPSQFYSRVRTGNLQVEVARNLKTQDGEMAVHAGVFLRIVSGLLSFRAWGRRLVRTHPQLRMWLSPIIAVVKSVAARASPLVAQKRIMNARDQIMIIPEALNAPTSRPH